MEGMRKLSSKTASEIGMRVYVLWYFHKSHINIILKYPLWFLLSTENCFVHTKRYTLWRVGFVNPPISFLFPYHSYSDDNITSKWAMKKRYGQIEMVCERGIFMWIDSVDHHYVWNPSIIPIWKTLPAPHPKVVNLPIALLKLRSHD